MSVFVGGIDEVLGHDKARHLQTGHVAIEFASHLWPVKAAGCTKLARNQTALFAKCREDDVIDGSLRRHRIFAATVVAKIGPPLTTDKSRFLIEKLDGQGLLICLLLL